jgi:hypothetical protein
LLYETEALAQEPHLLIENDRLFVNINRRVRIGSYGRFTTESSSPQNISGRFHLMNISKTSGLEPA